MNIYFTLTPTVEKEKEKPATKGGRRRPENNPLFRALNPATREGLKTKYEDAVKELIVLDDILTRKSDAVFDVHASGPYEPHVATLRGTKRKKHETEASSEDEDLSDEDESRSAPKDVNQYILDLCRDVGGLEQAVILALKPEMEMRKKEEEDMLGVLLETATRTADYCETLAAAESESESDSDSDTDSDLDFPTEMFCAALESSDSDSE